MAKCPICGEKIGALTKAKTADGVICVSCTTICASYGTLPTNTIQEYWNTNQARWETFTPTTVLKSFASETITIDETHKLFVIGDVKKFKRAPVVFSFDEVDSYEFETVGGKTVTEKKGGITRAIVGGAVAGPIGAIVGSGTAKAETKTVGSTQLTKVNFTTYAGKVQRVCSVYPTGFTAFLDRCIADAQAKSDAPATVPTSAADEILKYKALLDQGIITVDEFQAKKAQLLGL